MTSRRKQFGPEFYILRGKLAVPVTDAMEWGKNFEKSHRIVAQTFFNNVEPWLKRDMLRHRDANTSRARLGMSSRSTKDPREGARQIMVSTVFLGLNMNWGEGLPLIFETMIFNGPLHDEQDRYSTWEDAEIGHAQYCERVRAALVERQRERQTERAKR